MGDERWTLTIGAGPRQVFAKGAFNNAIGETVRVNSELEGYGWLMFDDLVPKTRRAKILAVDVADDGKTARITLEMIDDG